MFSAILAAFLIEVRKGLQEDLQENTNRLLAMLIAAQNGSTRSLGSFGLSSSPFEPSSTSLWLNGLWFVSLIFSLVSALGASLAKGWVAQYATPVSGVTWNNVKLRQRRYTSVLQSRLDFIIQGLPILIHIAFFLFTVGLSLLLIPNAPSLGFVIVALTTAVAVLYIASSFHSVFNKDSPFRTPITTFFVRNSDLSQYLEQPDPTSPEAWKAHALVWLLIMSTEEDGATLECINAMAGLPPTPSVRVQLLLIEVVDKLVPLIEKSSRGDTAFEANLHVLLRIVLIEPDIHSDNHKEVAARLTRLVKPGGPLYDLTDLKSNTYAIAFCVRACIQMCWWMKIDGKEISRAESNGELDVLLLTTSSIRNIYPPLQYVKKLYQAAGVGASTGVPSAKQVEKVKQGVSLCLTFPWTN